MFYPNPGRRTTAEFRMPGYASGRTCAEWSFTQVNQSLPRSLINCPRRVTARPRSINGLARRVMVCPWRINEVPGRIRRFPRRVTDLPRSIMNVSRGLSSCPRRVTGLPRCLRNFPRGLRRLPGRIGGCYGDVLGRDCRILKVLF